MLFFGSPESKDQAVLCIKNQSGSQVVLLKFFSWLRLPMVDICWIYYQSPDVLRLRKSVLRCLARVKEKISRTSIKARAFTVRHDIDEWSQLCKCKTRSRVAMKFLSFMFDRMWLNPLTQLFTCSHAEVFTDFSSSSRSGFISVLQNSYELKK